MKTVRIVYTYTCAADECIAYIEADAYTSAAEEFYREYGDNARILAWEFV